MKPTLMEKLSAAFVRDLGDEAATRFFRDGECVAVYSTPDHGKLLAYAVIVEGQYIHGFGHWLYQLKQHRTGARIDALSCNLRNLSPEEVRLTFSSIQGGQP